MRLKHFSMPRVILFEPITFTAAIIFFLKWLVGIIAGLLLLGGAIQLFEEFDVKDLGEVSATIEEIDDREFIQTEMRGIQAEIRMSIERTLKFDIEYDWPDRIDIGFKDPVSNKIKKGILEQLDNMPFVPDDFQLDQETTFKTEVVLDPDRSENWVIAWIDKVAHGTINIDRPDGSNESFKFSLVLFTEPRPRKL